MTSKNCSKCKKLKPLSEFYNSKSRKDGKHHECSVCQKEIRKAHRRTKEGRISNIYDNQTHPNKNRSRYLVEYSYLELLEWALSQDIFHVLYDNWVDSGFKKELSPSIDRVDCFLNYSFDNIQIITWAENNKKGRRETATKLRKQVNQYSLSGDFIKRHNSISDASKTSGDCIGSISQTCSGKQKSTKKFLWNYA